MMNLKQLQQTKLQLQNCLLVLLMVKIWSRVSGPIVTHLKNKFLNVLLIQTDLPCWNLVCSTYSMLATTNPISRTCTYDKHVENYGLRLINLVSSLFSISPMVALFTAHSGMYTMTILLHTSYPRLLFHLQEPIYKNPSALLCKNEKYQCAKVRFLCAKKDRI
jgi:hypothetical protein